MTTTFEYDARGNRTKSTTQDGKETFYSYDALGNVTQITKIISSTLQEVTKYQYDSMNRLVKVTSPKDEITQYTYLADGMLSTIKDPLNNITTFTYDSKGQLIEKSEPDNKHYSFSYDANGNRLTETDPSGNTKSYVYDELNRVTQVNLVDDQLNYTYNSKGEVLSASNSHSVISQTLDTRGRLVSSVTSGAGVSGNYPAIQMNYSYDGNSNRTELRSTAMNVNYFYDSLNRLREMTTSTGDVFQFTFDFASRMNSISRPGSFTNISYTAGGLLASIEHANGVEAVASNQYSYDLRNYPIQKRTLAGDFNYGYDSNGQLTSSQTPHLSETFAYDSIGNRVTDQSGSYVYNSSRKLIEQDYNFTYTHDQNGNMIGKYPKSLGQDKYQYLYTSTNQLKEVRVLADNDTPKRTVYYYYDPQGRRMSKKVTDHVDSSKSLERNYVYDGENIIAEYDGSGTKLATYTHSLISADDILASNITSAGESAGLASNQGRYFYLKDHLGSVDIVTNSSGSVVQKYEYSSFGKIVGIKDASGVSIQANPVINTSFTFTGREFDYESGLYFYRARTYDPSIGRFLQVDPDPGKLNMPNTFLSKYIYAINNSIMISDPSGRMGDIEKFFNNIINVGHDLIANFGAGLDQLLKSKVFQGILAIALYTAAIVVNPAAGLLALASSVTKASVQGGNTFDNFFRDPLPDAVGAIAGSIIALNSAELLAVPGLGTLFTGFVTAAGYVGAATTIISIGQTACNKEKGSYSGSDLCKAY